MATANVARNKSDAAAAASRAREAANRLYTYKWSGTDKRGAKINGEIQAKTLAMARAELRKQGVTPSAVSEKAKPLFGTAGKKIKPRDIAVFSRQIAVMMSAGVPLVQGLDIIGQGATNPRMKTMLLDVKGNIEGGSSLAESLAKYPQQFDDLFCNLVRAGESAGVLDTVLDTVATYNENTEALKGKIKKAMMYPIIVLLVAFTVTGILLVFAVPQFEAVFKGFGAQLPAFTQMVVNMSRFMTANWLIILIALGAAGFGFSYLHKHSLNFRRSVARTMLKIPVIGLILNQSAVARFARTLGVTFRAGVPLVDALDSVSQATGSLIYNDAVKHIKEEVAVGHQLQFSMRQANLFPSMVVQMVGIGEEAGALDTMLFKVAEFYEQEVNNAVDALSSLLEPFIMVIIGVVVGGIVVAMYLPIFQLGQVVG